MTQEETNKRNEAIAKMLGYNWIEDGWKDLMKAYELIYKLGYSPTIERNENYKTGFIVGISDYIIKDLSLDSSIDPGCPCNSSEDLMTAIWLTVSDFAMDFNKKKDGTT